MPGKSVQVAMEGLDELRNALKALPAELQSAARDRVIAAADDAAAKLRASYPVGTSGRKYQGRRIDPGGLRRGVKVVVEENKASTIATVKSTAPHAHLWEFGTEVRATQKLINRGAAPAHHDQGLIGIAIRRRRQLQSELKAIVEQSGSFVVTETP